VGRAAWSAAGVVADRRRSRDLRARLAAPGDDTRDRPAIANLRHTVLLDAARDAVPPARVSRPRPARRRSSCSPTFTRRAPRSKDVTGARPQDEVLRTIFERFCIGK
jgi:tRNA U34 5-carboxymethylaminomethyl modifying GTPase MnmE/TrmE